MRKTTLLATVFLLSACATPSQNVYDFKEAGQSTIVDFGTIVQAREIKITGENSGVGGLVGGVAGAGAGSNIGGGNGAIYGAIGGAIAGAVVGSVAEQALKNKVGVEYTIVTEHKEVLTIPQYVKKDEPIFKKGDRVMIQTSGSYQRVLSTEGVLDKVKRPKGIEIID